MAQAPAWLRRAGMVRQRAILLGLGLLLLYCGAVLRPGGLSGLSTPILSLLRPGAAPVLGLQTMPFQLLNESRPPPLEELESLGDDNDTLLDLRGFRWLLRGDPPPRCSPLVLVLVHSAPANLDKRSFIRGAWGSWARQDEILVRFFVGVPDADVQRHLEAESAAFGDLVQGPFVDSYRNLTYKHTMALKWFTHHCPHATYVLKVDDDVLVNPSVLLDFARHSLSPHGARDLLLCAPELRGMAKRSWRSKWRVSYSEYAERYYPVYCFGYAVMYSPDVALRLYREAQLWSRDNKYLWIDDVVVTGILAARLGLLHASWEPLVLSRADLPRVLRAELRPTFMLASLDLLDISVDTERRLWQRIVSE